MVVEAQAVDEGRKIVQERQHGHTVNAIVQDVTQDQGHDEGHNLIARQERRENSDRYKYRTDQQQADVRTQDCSGIDVAYRVPQAVYGIVIDDGRYQGEDHQQQAGEVFPQDQLPIGDGLCQEQFECPVFFLFCKRTHGDGRNQKQKGHGTEREQAVEFCKSIIQDVGFRKHPGVQTDEGQEHHDHQVGNEGMDEMEKFFFYNGQHST